LAAMKIAQNKALNGEKFVFDEAGNRAENFKPTTVVFSKDGVLASVEQAQTCYRR
jgi:hypothetical protein